MQAQNIPIDGRWPRQQHCYLHVLLATHWRPEDEEHGLCNAQIGHALPMVGCSFVLLVKSRPPSVSSLPSSTWSAVDTAMCPV